MHKKCSAGTGLLPLFLTPHGEHLDTDTCGRAKTIPEFHGSSPTVSPQLRCVVNVQWRFALNASLVMGLALGMRHGTDPDHLAAIDGLTRIRPRTTNGIYFALGHALVVMLLAMGLGHFLASRLAFVGPWSLIVIGLVNLWRLLRGAAAPRITSRPIVVQPVLLGMLLAAGFE